MVKRVLFCFLAVLFFITPCFAIDNTLGVVEERLLFYGFSVDELGYCPQYSSNNGFSVPKELSTRENLDIDGSYIYFFFHWPTLADELSFQGTISLSTSSSWLQGSGGADVEFYGGTRDSYNNLSYTSLGSSYAYMSINSDQMSFRFIRPTTLFNDSYYYLVICMRTSSANNNCELIRSLNYTFTDSFSGSYEGETSLSGSYSGSTSGTLSPSASTQKVTSYLDMSDVTSSGTIDLGDVNFNYYNNSSTNASIYGLFKFVPLYDGSETYLSFVDRDNLKNALPNITSESTLSGSATLSSSTSTVSYSGTRSSFGTMSASGDDEGTLSGSGSGTLLASSTNDVMAYAQLSATYGDDGGLVDEVFRQGDVMDDIASNMQQVVDDLQDHYDTAQDIGGTTSASQISGAQETLSSGLVAMDDLSSTAVTSIGGLNGGMQGYATLLSATIPSMLAIGDGDPLYWQLIGIITLSSIGFVLRRVLH